MQWKGFLGGIAFAVIAYYIAMVIKFKKGGW